MRRISFLTASTVIVLISATVTAQAPDSPRYRAAVSTSEFLAGEHSSVEFAKAKVVGLQPAGPQTAQLDLKGADGRRVVLVDFETDAPHGITNIAVEGGPSLTAPAAVPEAPADALTWDNLEQRLEAAAAAGFSGAILMIRDGEAMVEHAYGMANREARIANRMDTIFGIGSTPIDFTHVGILLLVQQGKLSFDDPITKFFDKVPEDKRGITVEHLRTSRSGLQDFLGRPGDGNPDHTWIDRDEAMRRIFEDELLFEPGTGRRHSHAAWGVLAAILEIVSGESYQEFTRKRIFKPLGMVDTGFFGEPLPRERLAVGYGIRSNGEINAPPYWGKTSWLVLGSGGQVSTVPDMHRFVTGLRAGKLLEEPMRERLFSTWRGVLAGGSIFGYEIIYTAGPGNMMILISNYNPDGGQSQAVALGEALAGLALQGTGAKFSLGVGLDFDPQRGLVISRVVSGSAAERDGLKAGDRLLSANGEPFGDDPLELLDPYLASGEKIEFTIERGGESMKVTVKPNPR